MKSGSRAETEAHAHHLAGIHLMDSSSTVWRLGWRELGGAGREGEEQTLRGDVEAASFLRLLQAPQTQPQSSPV